MSENTGVEIRQSRHTDREIVDMRIDELRTEVFELLKLESEDGGFSEWQKIVIDTLAEELRADQTVDLPTRSGKSHLMREIARAVSESGLRVAIVSPTKVVLNEHEARLAVNNVATERLALNGNSTATDAAVTLISSQSIAINRDVSPEITEGVDVVLIDEVHKVLGEKTVEGVRNLFPDAVRIVFTATPRYGANRSVTDEYGEEIISKSIVEAINENKVPPVRSLIYKTGVHIDNIDPNQPEFTSKELKKLIDFRARNEAIVDFAEDLVAEGRQGLITTVPGEDLLHADVLEAMLSERQITTKDGTTRPIRSRVVRGTDRDFEDVHKAYENGEIDILLYCDAIREGFTSEVASFLINGRPRTSIVSLTQDIGRILNKKSAAVAQSFEEMLVIDFLDDSTKQQVTAYDVLELDRATQAIVSSGNTETDTKNEGDARGTYLRNIFRPELADKLLAIDNKLITELFYRPGVRSPFERAQEGYAAQRVEEFEHEMKRWGKKLLKLGMPEEPQPDLFVGSQKALTQVDPDFEEEGYVIEIGTRTRAQLLLHPDPTPWSIYESTQGVVPPIPVAEFSDSEIGSNRKSTEMTAIADPQEHVDSGLTAEIENILDTVLKGREKAVLSMRFGLGGYSPHTLEETKKEFGLSRERIRQIETKAFTRLKSTEAHTNLLRHIQDGEPQDTIPLTGKRIANNRELMKQRDEYFDTLYDELFMAIRSGRSAFIDDDRETAWRMIGAGRKAVAEVAKHFGASNHYDFAAQNRFAQEWGNNKQLRSPLRIFDVARLILATEVPLLTPDERDRFREKTADKVEQVTEIIKESR